MAISPTTIRLLVEAGLRGEVLERVLESINADVTESVTNNARNVTRNANAERQARFRARQRYARNATVTPLARVDDNSSKIQNPGKEEKKERKKAATVTALRAEDPEFIAFWGVYPHRVGKGDARKAWPKALEKAGDLAVILEGVQRYIRDKPPDCPPCNPSTWLNQERWADQPHYANGNTEGEVLYKFSTAEEFLADLEHQRKNHVG